MGGNVTWIWMIGYLAGLGFMCAHLVGQPLLGWGAYIVSFILALVVGAALDKHVSGTTSEVAQ